VKVKNQPTEYHARQAEKFNGLLVPATSSPTLDAATVQFLGSYTNATGVSGDGTVVTYDSSYSSSGSAGLWIQGTGAHDLQGVPPAAPYQYGFLTQALAVSQDASTVIGSSSWDIGAGNSQVVSPDSPTVWQGASPAYLLPKPDGAVSNAPADAVNANGSIAVGQTVVSFAPYRTEAASWVVGGASQVLGLFPGGLNSNATGISGDGSIVVGSGDEHIDVTGENTIQIDHNSLPFLWTAPSGMQQLPLPSLADDGSANAISANGSTIVGQAGPDAAIWQIDPRGIVNSNGQSPITLHTLGVLPGGTYSVATAVSGDGSIVVGYGDTPANGTTAFLWTSQLGMVDLNSYLPSFGYDMTGVFLTRANGISADGKTIVGYGGYIGPSPGQGWIATLPVPEPSCLVLAAIASATLAFVARRF
jgi:probable HAF family extracellular repeat protein